MTSLCQFPLSEGNGQECVAQWLWFFWGSSRVLSAEALAAWDFLPFLKAQDHTEPPVAAAPPVAALSFQDTLRLPISHNSSLRAQLESAPIRSEAYCSALGF